MAHKNWLFNILIRSSGRPKYFTTCISRIREQTYRHYRLYVACDDDDTACYLEKYKDIEVIRVNPVTDNPPPRSAVFGRGFRAFFPNLYLNALLALVEDGFIIFLDDDDCFIRPDALAIINDTIDSEDDLVFWKVMFSKTRTVPNEAHFAQAPKFTQINTSGFTFNWKYAQSARWDAWSGADYFVAKKLHDLVPYKKYIPKKLTGMQEPYGIAGHGHRLDKVVNAVDLKNHFETTGYAPPFRLFTAKQIAEIWRWISKDPKAKPVDWEKGLAVNSRFFFELSTHEHIMQRVNAILGKDVILWGCSIVARPPGTAHPWHCDIEAAAITQSRTVNAWIGLKNTQSENGILLIPFTHRLNSIQEELSKHKQNRRDVSNTDVVDWAQDKEARSHLIHPDLADGDCIMFDGNTWHSSRNTTSNVRYALLLQFATPSARIRMPDINNFGWPFRQIDIPKPPVILISGDDHAGLNYLVPPPPAIESPGTFAIRQSRIYPLQLPLPFQTKQRWRPFPIFNGYTADMQHITCHVSALAPEHQPHPPHKHKEEEILLVLHGSADVILPSLGADHRVRLGPGDFVYYPAHFPHTLEGVAENGVNYLMLKWFNDVPSPMETLPFYQYVSNGQNGNSDKAIDFGMLFEGPTTSLSKLHAHTTRLAPGASYAPHVDPYDVAIIVLAGQVETLDQEVVAGQVIFYPAGVPHGMANVSDAPATYLVFEFHGSTSVLNRSEKTALPILAQTEKDVENLALRQELQKLHQSYSLKIGRKITKIAGDCFSWLPSVKKRMY